MSGVTINVPTWEGSGSDPNQPLLQDVMKLLTDRAQMAQDLSAIGTALEQMLHDLQSGDPNKVFTAMMVALYQIFPAIEAYKGDNIEQLADSENVGSDLRSFITGAQASFNTACGTAPNQDAANDLYNYIHDLDGNAPISVSYNGTTYTYSNWVSFLSDTSGSSGSFWQAINMTPPLDTDTASYLDQATAGIKEQFDNPGDPGSTPPIPPVDVWGQSNFGDYISDLYNTSIGNTSGIENPLTQTGAMQSIKSVQSELQQSTQSVSTMATSVQTNEQFYTQEYNQILGIDNNLLQGESKQDSNFVQNQKTS